MRGRALVRPRPESTALADPPARRAIALHALVPHQPARRLPCMHRSLTSLSPDAVQACLACTGTIVCTGVGKSGFIAQKICQTLVSTGTKALYLSPTDALHGDIGILTAHDLLVCFSKSGGTDELLRLIPYAKVWEHARALGTRGWEGIC